MKILSYYQLQRYGNEWLNFFIRYSILGTWLLRMLKFCICTFVHCKDAKSEISYFILAYRQDVWKISFYFGIFSHKLIGSPVCLYHPMQTWLVSVNSAVTTYDVLMTVYFLSPDVRWEPTPPAPSWWLVGGVLVVKSDYKFWVQAKGSPVLAAVTGLWLGVVLTASSSSATISPLYHSQKKSKLYLPVELLVFPFSYSQGCLRLLLGFHLAVFGNCSRSPVFPPDYHENHLT